MVYRRRPGIAPARLDDHALFEALAGEHGARFRPASTRFVLVVVRTERLAAVLERLAALGPCLQLGSEQGEIAVLFRLRRTVAFASIEALEGPLRAALDLERHEAVDVGAHAVGPQVPGTGKMRVIDQATGRPQHRLRADDLSDILAIEPVALGTLRRKLRAAVIAEAVGKDDEASRRIVRRAAAGRAAAEQRWKFHVKNQAARLLRIASRRGTTTFPPVVDYRPPARPRTPGLLPCAG